MPAPDGHCQRFEANIFDRSRCQNCFKPREQHLLANEDLAQARPVYGGWLCLAPEGTNFENAGHRSRKWQRRFFVLFEHGVLQFALDSSPSTLPQGTLNLTQCTEVSAAAEERTGRKHSLRVAAADRELFIGAESREDISAWQERLVAFAHGNRANLVKKRRPDVQLDQDVILTHAVQVNMSASADAAHRSPTAERVDLPRCSVTRCPAGVGMRPERPPSGTFTFDPAAHRGHPGPAAAQPPPSRSHNGSRGDERGHHHQAPAPGPHGPPHGSPHGASRSSASPWEGVPAFPRGRSPGPRGPAAPQDVRDHRAPASRARSPEARHGPAFPAEASSGERANGTRSPYPRGRSPGPRAPVERPDGGGGGNRRASERDDDDDTWRRSRGGGAGAGAGPTAGGGVASASDSDTSGSGEGRRGREYACLADVPRARRIGHRDSFVAEKRRLEHKLRTRSPGRDEVERLFGKARRSLGQNQGSPHDREIDRSALSDAEERVDASFHSPVTRDSPRGRAAEPKVMAGAPTSPREPHPSHGSFRRSQSLDRHNAAPTADSASLKKGWLTWLDDDNQWRKFWFVLTPGALKFCRDTPSEERDNAEGVVELSPHCEIAEFQVQRNYGFQIKTKYAVHTLYAVTSGIRKSWMEAIGRSLGPGASAQEKMSSPEKSWPGRSPPDNSPSSPRDRPPGEPAADARDSSPERTRSRPKARVREARAKTMDCSEFQAVHQALVRSQRGGGGGGGGGGTVRPSALTPARLDRSARAEDAPGGHGGHGGATYKTYFQTSHAAAAVTGPRAGHDPGASDRFRPRPAAPRSAEPEGRRVSERAAQPPPPQHDRKPSPPRGRPTPPRELGGGGNACGAPGFARGSPGASDGKARGPLTTARSPAALLPDKQGPDPSWVATEKGRGGGDEVDAPAGRRAAREGEGPTAAGGRPPLGRDEIEQRWRQVEKTPVREEKQIPIATIKPTASSMSPESMVELLQKEVDDLHWQLDNVNQDLRGSRGENSALSARLRAIEQAEYPPAGFVSQLNVGVAAEYATRRSGGKEDLLERGARRSAEIRPSRPDPADDDDNDAARALRSQLRDAEARLREAEEALVRKTKACLELEEAATSAQERHRAESRRLRQCLDDAEERLAGAGRERADAELRREERARADAERCRREGAEAAAARLEAEERRRRELEDGYLRLEAQVGRLEAEKASDAHDRADAARGLEQQLAQSEAAAHALAQKLRSAGEENDALRSEGGRLREELSAERRSRAAAAAAAAAARPEERPVVQIDGQPMEWLDKDIELQDMAARHRAEVRDMKAAFQKEAERLRAEARRADEALKARALESVQEMDSLTVCMENMQRGHREELRRRQDELRDEASRQERRLEERARDAAERHRRELAAAAGDARDRERRFGDAIEGLLRRLSGSEENGPAGRRGEGRTTDDDGHDGGGDLGGLVERLVERVEETLREFGVAKRELELLRPQGDPAALRDAFQRDLEEVKVVWPLLSIALVCSDARPRDCGPPPSTSRLHPSLRDVVLICVFVVCVSSSPPPAGPIFLLRLLVGDNRSAACFRLPSALSACVASIIFPHFKAGPIPIVCCARACRARRPSTWPGHLLPTTCVAPRRRAPTLRLRDCCRRRLAFS